MWWRAGTCSYKSTAISRDLHTNGRSCTLSRRAGAARRVDAHGCGRGGAAALPAARQLCAGVCTCAPVGGRAAHGLHAGGGAARDGRHGGRPDDWRARRHQRLRDDPADPRGHPAPGAAADRLPAAADLVHHRADGAAHFRHGLGDGPAAHPAADGLDRGLRGHWRRADGPQGGQVDGLCNGRGRGAAQSARRRHCAVFAHAGAVVHHPADCKRHLV